MGIITALLAALGMNQDSKNFKKGEKFERCTECFFPESHYILVEKSHDYKKDKNRFVESSLKPDFKFRDKQTGRCFYVESKYRSELYKGKLQWSNPKQLQRYNKYNEELPVFILIGLGGRATNPDKVYLIPLTKAKYPGLFPAALKEFIVEYNIPVSHRELWNR